jgi:hypothetical protein
MKTASFKKSPFWAGVLVVVLILAGMTIQAMGQAGQTTLRERSFVSAGKTVVFLRMKGFLDNKLFEEVPLMSGPNEKGFGIQLRPQGKSATPMFVQLHRIDQGDSGQKGWLYFLSDPGNYELEFVQNQGRGQKALAPSFNLRVPPQKSFVYTGSVHLYCKMKPGFWAPTLGECQDIRVTDEGTTALNVVKPLYGESGQVYASILEKKGQGIMPASSKNWFPMGLITAGAKEMGSPDWTKRGIRRTTGLGGTATADQVVTGVAQGQWIGLAYLLYLPVGVSLGAIAGKAAEKKWQPCLQRLSREIQQLDPTRLLRQELQRETKKYSPMPPVEFESTRISSQEVTRRNLKSLLMVEVQRILMRESRERGTFSLEVAIKASLSEMPRNNKVYEAELVYTNPDPVTSTSKAAPSEAAGTLKLSPCRHMETYCGAEGAKILQEDLSQGVHYLVERLLLELGFFSRAGSKLYTPKEIPSPKKMSSQEPIQCKNIKVVVEDGVNTEYSKGLVALLAPRLHAELAPLGYNLVERGEDLTLQVKITSFSPGNRAKRILVGFGGAGKAELSYVAQFLNKSGSIVSQTSGGKTITAIDHGLMLSDKKIRESLIQESVKHIGKFVQDYLY